MPGLVVVVVVVVVVIRQGGDHGSRKFLYLRPRLFSKTNSAPLDARLGYATGVAHLQRPRLNHAKDSAAR
jgi:hypothetical protein